MATVLKELKEWNVKRGLGDERKKRAKRIRDKCGRFRLLVIGRANAGKTTILKVICNTTEDPEIFDGRGRKIESSVLTPSEARGQHNIENEMVFRSNPGFIFHDSLGFEAGGTDELKKVEAFIAERSRQTKMHDQVHAIWYCIPMDDSRPFTKAETRFFSECGTGNVPVIVIFTKFDAQDNKAYRALRNELLPIQDAIRQAPIRAVQDFESLFLERLYGSRYRPRGHIYLRDMHKSGARCEELTERTASALDDNILRRLFVSTQQNNLKVCIEHALKSVIMKEIDACDPTSASYQIGSNLALHGMTKDDIRRVYLEVLHWFPHSYRRTRDVMSYQVERRVLDLLDDDLHPYIDDPDDLDHYLAHTEPLAPRPLSTESLSHIIGDPPGMLQTVRLGVATTIIAEHSFFLWERKQKDCYQVAYMAYRTSHQCSAVMEDVDKAFRDNNGQISLGPLEHGQVRVQKTFVPQLVQIALDNRLPKDSLD